MRSLVLGRFQPLHLGHVKMIEHVADRSTFITIGLGSCNSRPGADNPFVAEEREEMIKKSLSLKIPYEIKRIPDFGDNGKWMDWIRCNINFDTFWTNSPNERQLFQDAGLQVKEIPFFEREKYSATEVRKRILEDGNWINLLPQGSTQVMGTLDGINRIKKLSCR
jgi:nicotinamide-nucleotide adenylyltransferase